MGNIDDFDALRDMQVMDLNDFKFDYEQQKHKDDVVERMMTFPDDELVPVRKAAQKPFKVTKYKLPKQKAENDAINKETMTAEFGATKVVNALMENAFEGASDEEVNEMIDREFNAQKHQNKQRRHH